MQDEMVEQSFSTIEIANTTAALNQVSRMTERVAALEARHSTETASIKDDLRAMRQNMHDVRNQMQILVGAEQRFTTALTLMEGKFAIQGTQIDKLIATVERLVAENTKNEGAWWALGKVVIVLGFTSSGVAAAATLVWWILNFVAEKAAHGIAIH